MKRITYNLFFLLATLAVLFSGCTRDGADQDFSVKTGFQPIANLEGQAGYGAAKFEWQLPDSTSSLFCIEVVYQTGDSEAARQVISRYKDGVTINGLDAANYTFTFTSVGEDGERKVEDPVSLDVMDWRQEPPANVTLTRQMVAENSLMLNWTNPLHRTFDAVTFEIYKGDELVKSQKIAGTDAPEYIFTGLEFQVDSYSLKYFSVSPVGVSSDTSVWNFATGDVPPATPEVRVDLSDFDAAHCADVVWDKTADMDTVLIRYTDMNQEARECRFDADRWGYLSLLPGGTVELEVQVKGKNGTWSFPKKQKIKTRLTEETYLPRIPNGPSSTMSKLSEAMYQAFGRGTADEFKKDQHWLEEYSFKEMAELRDFACIWEIYHVDEIHLFVNLEVLKIQSYGSLTAANCPSVEEFKTLIDRLPKIKELQVVGGYPIYKKLETEFSNHPKITFKKL